MSLIEIPATYLESLDKEITAGQLSVRCNYCGSYDVLGFGKPLHNKKYFLCLGCEKEFTVNIYKQEWDELYKKSSRENPEYDLWLERYEYILDESRDLPIIDLGCGHGNDTIYLARRGFETISCDYSNEALSRLKHFIDDPNVMHFDMLEGLPFNNDVAKIVIANLSLHYFSWEDTRQIIREIKRILMKDGYLLCRVNSVNDKEHGAGQGIQIEKNYYDVEGKLKRFFDKPQLIELLIDWDIIYMQEHCIERFKNRKFLWEVVVKRL